MIKNYKYFVHYNLDSKDETSQGSDINILEFKIDTPENLIMLESEIALSAEADSAIITNFILLDEFEE